MNPQNTQVMFYDDYCEVHQNQKLSLICLQENCESYLSLECMKCHHNHHGDSQNQSQNSTFYQKHTHTHCQLLQKYIEKSLYPQRLKKLTYEIKKRIKNYRNKINEMFDSLIDLIDKDLYKCLPESCTKKQCLICLQIPQKLSKIQQTARIKDQILSAQINQLILKFRSDLQRVSNKLTRDFCQLRYLDTPQKWKFNSNQVHQLLNISPSLRTIDKKSEILKYCIGIVNQPLTPYKQEVAFTINSQNIYSKYIIVGLCDPNKAFKNNYELPQLSFEPSSPSHPSNKKKKNRNQEQNCLTVSAQNMGLYGIYQASNYHSMNNALSIHSSRPELNYKQIVGWNFGSGDTITIGLNIVQNFSEQTYKGDEKLKLIKECFIWFRKNGMKEKFQLPINISAGFLYPFVALYASGDKITVDPK